MPFTRVSHEAQLVVLPQDDVAGLEPGEVSLHQASLDLLQAHADEREPGLGHCLAQMHGEKLRERKDRPLVDFGCFSQ